KFDSLFLIVFFFQAEDGIRDFHVTGVQTCALPIFDPPADRRRAAALSSPFRVLAWGHEARTLHAEGPGSPPAGAVHRPPQRPPRSEERRVGKESRSRRQPCHEQTKCKAHIHSVSTR